LCKNESVKRVNLQGNCIGDPGAASLAKALRGHVNFETLLIGRNEIGDKGIEAIALALNSHENTHENTHEGLRELDMYGNAIGYVGAEQLAEALRSNRSLKKLYLYNNRNIGIYGAQSFSAAIQANNNLHTIDLSYCNLGYSGAQTLADMLTNYKDLCVFCISGNDLQDYGAELIASALSSKDTKLQELRLGYNWITDSGAQALAKAFAVVHHLAVVDLDDNKIEDEGAKAIADALRSKMPKIAELGMLRNKITDKGAKALKDAAWKNINLPKVRLEIPDPCA